MAVGKSTKEMKFMNDIIGGGLSVDIMDYLLRDSYFTGVEYGKVDVHRIINSFRVVGGKLAISQAAVFAFEALMISRYEMFRAVYFHRTVRAAELDANQVNEPGRQGTEFDRSLTVQLSLVNGRDYSLQNFQH